MDSGTIIPRDQLLSALTQYVFLRRRKAVGCYVAGENRKRALGRSPAFRIVQVARQNSETLDRTDAAVAIIEIQVAAIVGYVTGSLID